MFPDGNTFLPEATYGYHNYIKLLLFGWCQNHNHLATFHLGHLLDRCNVQQIDFDPLDLAHADFLVGHFTATEAQGDFHLVFFLQEARHVAQLDLVVVFVRTRPQLDFLDLNLLLLELLLMLAFLFLVLEFAVIHDPANRRLRQRSDLDQIYPGFFCQMKRLPSAHDPECFPFDADQSDFRGVYLFVDAMRLLQCDGFAPCPNKN